MGGTDSKDMRILGCGDDNVLLREIIQEDGESQRGFGARWPERASQRRHVGTGELPCSRGALALRKGVPGSAPGIRSGAECRRQLVEPGAPGHVWHLSEAQVC